MSKEQKPEKPVVELVPAPAHPPKINLHNSTSIRREMAAVYRDMRAGRLETQDGTRLVYVLSHIQKAYELQVIEERVKVLEEASYGET